jgi:hypothetical protein
VGGEEGRGRETIMRAAGAWEVWTAFNDAGWYYSDPEGEDDD